MQTTSFDSPRVLSHHNPFASLHDTSDDPLASSLYSSTPTIASGEPADDPWNSYSPSYIDNSGSQQRTATTTSASSNAALNGILDEENIPPLYTQAWTTATASSASTSYSNNSAFAAGHSISLATLQKVLSSAAGLGAGDTERIINLVSTSSSPNLASSYAVLPTSPTSPFRSTTAGQTSGGRITRLEFFIALALAGLAQRKESVSLQALSSRKHNLPVPSLALSSMQSTGSTFTSSRPIANRNPSSSTTTTPYRPHKMSIGSVSDPWSANNPSVIQNSNSNGQTSSHDPFSTTSTSATAGGSGSTTTGYTVTGEPPSYSPPRGREQQHNHGHGQQSSTGNNGYSSFPSFHEADEQQQQQHNHGQQPSTSYHHQANHFPSDNNNDDDDADFGSAAIGGSSNHNNNSNSSAALLSLPPFTSAIDLSRTRERITIIQQSELAGNFLTRHTVYRVESEKAKMSVLRRYSDWLFLDSYLEAKFSSRMRLALPPKRMGISARHVSIASDEQFLERRRRGLMRYTEFLSNHPIMRHDSVVRAFLQETMDLSLWRKSHSSEINDVLSGGNGKDKHHPADEANSIGRLTTSQESLIPTSFEAIISTLIEALPSLIESLTRFCALLERINARKVQNASDLIRAKMALDSFAECYSGLNKAGNGYAGKPIREIDEDSTILINRDLKEFSETMGNIAEREERTLAEFNDLTLEKELKTQRDGWKALFTLLNKYETKLKHDNVDKIKKRIEGYQSKYSNLNTVQEGNRRANHVEELGKLVKNIEDDQFEIERLLNRRAFFKWSLMAEIRFTWRLSTLLRVQLNDWIARENQHQMDLSRIWSSLDDALSIA